MKNQTKWYFWTMDNRSFQVTSDDGKIFHNITAHCLACAKAEVLAKYGGKVDARGHNDTCGAFLKSMQHVVNLEKKA